MKVAYINADPGVPVFGTKGASLHVREMLRALAHHGADIDLFATRLGGDAPADLAGIRVHELPVAKTQDPAQREQALLDVNAVLRERLANCGEFGLIYERYSLWSCAGMEFARERGVPSLLEVNAPLVEEQSKHRTLVHRAAAEDVATRAFGAASVISVVSRQLGEIISRHPAANGRVRVAPNAVNPERFASLAPARAKSPDEFVVGFVGTLKPWHGMDTLAKAFIEVAPRLPQARLLIVGDGPERAALDGEFARAGLSGSGRIHFTGAVDSDDVPGWLAAMDVAVAPYPRLDDFYFSPLKVFEYMAAGLPVVGSRIGQVEEIMAHGGTGILVPPGDPAALAEALLQLAAAPSQCAALGEAARKFVLGEHTWDKVAAQVLRWTGVAEKGEAAG
jgi:glycosyltransferase involved in cell wall biosynthesis